MPKVSGKKRTTQKRGSSRRQSGAGLLEQAGATLDGFMQRALRILVTYTAVSVTGAVMVLVLMLFAGGYFFNVGERIANLTQDMSRAAGFEVARITLKGAVQTGDREILSALYDQEYGQAVGRSLLHVDIEGARQRVEEIGWVRSAAVARLYPNTLHVSISERLPAALWQPSGAGELFLIDRDGAVITEVGSHQYTGLPLIINTDDPLRAQGVLTEIARYPGLSARIAALKEQGNRRWDLIFRNDFVVKLPEDDFAVAIEKLYALETGTDGLSQSLEYLDLRNSDTVYYQPKSQS